MLMGNQITGSAGADERDRIAPMLTFGTLEAKSVLSEAGEDTRRVYFPLSGAVCLDTIMLDGSIVATSVIGNEGLVGIGSYLGQPQTGNVRTIVLLGGDALSMPSLDFREATHPPGRLHDAMQWYVSTLLSQAVQAIACNRLHAIQERCARWLLLLHDRMRGDVLSITQDSLADMLGTHRPSLSQAVGALKDQGVIELRRGSVRVVDRIALEDAACECYAVMKAIGNGVELD
jgi:CRP-like cAMP-binding protein